MRIFNFVQSKVEGGRLPPYTADHNIGISDSNPTPNELKPPLINQYYAKMEAHENFESTMG